MFARDAMSGEVKGKHKCHHHPSSTCQYCMLTLHVNTACQYCMSILHVGITCQYVRLCKYTTLSLLRTIGYIFTIQTMTIGVLGIHLAQFRREFQLWKVFRLNKSEEFTFLGKRGALSIYGSNGNKWSSTPPLTL